VSAYFIQAKFLKGNAMPALPPITVMSIIGLVLDSPSKDQKKPLWR
jgi:hypothetical protein